MKALIFDFDGVVADSEGVANAVLAEEVTRLGRSTTLDDALDRYCGRRWADVMALIAEELRAPLPGDFAETVKAATLARFETGLREVEGAGAFIRRHIDLPRAVASSSAPDRLALCLRVLGFADLFGAHVYSADRVAHGKPHPDIFLLAAAGLGVEPARCLVIEDSPNGIRAAVAAGMRPIGLCAGSHIRDGHDALLREAGAAHVARTWREVGALAEAWLAE